MLSPFLSLSLSLFVMKDNTLQHDLLEFAYTLEPFDNHRWTRYDGRIEGFGKLSSFRRCIWKRFVSSSPIIGDGEGTDVTNQLVELGFLFETVSGD